MGAQLDLDDLVYDWPEAKAELARLRAERDELRAAAKRLSEERRSGLASLDAWVQLRSALSRTEGGEVVG